MAAVNKTPRIIIAEDNPADVLLIREALDLEGLPADIQEISDGDQAIQLIRSANAYKQQTPDLILLDLNLPKRTGHEVLRELQNSSLAGVPVIIVTSSNAAKDQELASRYSPARYFQKPADLDAFMRIGSVIRQMLQARRISDNASL
jgi:CheY-like chemotaxis protein